MGIKHKLIALEINIKEKSGYFSFFMLYEVDIFYTCIYVRDTKKNSNEYNAADKHELTRD